MLFTPSYEKEKKILEKNRLLTQQAEIAKNERQKINLYIRAFDSLNRSKNEMLQYKFDFAKLYEKIGAALIKFGKEKEGEDCFENAIELSKNYSFLLSKGRAFAEKNDYEKALACFDKILEKEKGEEVLIERGDTLLKLGRDIEALASYKNALVLLMKHEKYDDGIRCYEKMIKIKPEPELYFELAELLIKAQRFEDALACYNKVSSIFPDEPKISEGLERLKEAKEMKKIEDFCKRILEIEGKIDRELSKEEAFKDAKIPFEYLEKVMKYIRSEVEVNIDELKEIEEKPSAEILKKYNIEKLKLSNILSVFPKYSIERAKKLLSYIKTVNESSIDIGIVDVSFEENVRKALEIEKENRNIQNICAKLGIGIYEGKKVEKLLSQLKDEVNVTKISKLEEKKIELPPEKISREISRIEEREKTFLPQTTKKDEKKEIKKKIDMEFWRDTI